MMANCDAVFQCLTRNTRVRIRPDRRHPAKAETLHNQRLAGSGGDVFVVKAGPMLAGMV
jgi:hypothetical protein